MPGFRPKLFLRFRLGNHLFVKVPRPGDSEVTFSVFESSCRALLKDTTSELFGLSHTNPLKS